MGAENEAVRGREDVTRIPRDVWWRRAAREEEIRRRAQEDARRSFEKVREEVERLAAGAG